ncbi:tRNA (adenosine(37)-N6)-threonylcarbamoyltransferase complex dimerization subunit type 1 TsaB [Luteolibacter flavescens]|uniref:tRNA (Adenosine(37)-N6)-threonylcarbamoyltransferase complex dimerization subunit type 1 TsaB n=1 Tax=Luteolibacter flavescens TaxID=1859460 RepID=A0ABT3FLA0_9BACT|nr:tRNA (adenosine(37)-N6)-threonylcarbamoyltransferase complex dimerization subunit type 1 TsaB [Luteolibacter flavescens]MCW1884343.1 tRNA (adenosine(37)-N6)-threonylcarbamoyltransferase complex dimerization subunit type 1 TsaB [Luteolibacter flavescens]
MPETARLFIESSTARASLALLRGADIVFQETFTGDRSHNALLFDPLERALACLNQGEALAEIVIGTGPGSYSGTRVGIAAGQGVALVHGCPAIGLSSLLAVPSARAGALAVGDARRGSAWRAGYGQEPVLCDVDTLANEIRGVLGAGLPVYSLESVAKVGLPEDLASQVTTEQPTAAQLAKAWLALPAEDRARLAAQPVQPAYLRPPHVTEAKGGHPLLRR